VAVNFFELVKFASDTRKTIEAISRSFDYWAANLEGFRQWISVVQVSSRRSPAWLPGSWAIDALASVAKGYRRCKITGPSQWIAKIFIYHVVKHSRGIGITERVGNATRYSNRDRDAAHHGTRWSRGSVDRLGLRRIVNLVRLVSEVN
jgi:hypothetical protein